MRSYCEEYEQALKETIRGIRIRAFFFGYGSDRVKTYITQMKREIDWIRSDAIKSGERVNSKENLGLDARLTHLKLKAEMTRAGIPTR